ncbi:LysR family transcriptional regulator [Paenibacillus sp. SC116]|uniref:LysR family transcriptional regulator n=1 Tax=Paenibacillus sp. SC116 TaxID=2968986 RepID=UPI00215B4CF2|nr:LysR family transcriptional regulator [Paenibacillus sp. SC116]MCR8845248.1 LysR family transcriptional regulator [Paenibacillus sp. SC116]
MAVSFHQLHIFYTVAAKSSFSAAAQALHMTQPAVTMQIQSVEDYFGTKLFHRSTKKLQLSDAGRTLIPFAKQAINLVQATEEAMSLFTKQLHGKLQLGASLTIGEYVIPPLLGTFITSHPEMTISMGVMNTTQIVEGIRQHQLHLGLVEAPVNDPDMITEEVMEDELFLVVPKGHSFIGRASVALEEALTCAFILREKGSGTRQVMENVLRDHGHSNSSLRIVMELGSTGAVKSAVESGLGVTIMSKSAVRHECSLGLVAAIPIDGISFKRKFYAIQLKDSMLAWPAMAFLTYLRQQSIIPEVLAPTD